MLSECIASADCDAIDPTAPICVDNQCQSE